MILGFCSYCLSLNNTCFYRSSRQVPTQQPIICCLSHCKNFFRMLVVTSLNCSYWWVLFNPLHITMHAYLKCSATVHTDRFFSLLQMGPFIDSDHPVMKKGTVDQSFHDIFYSEVLRKVGKCWFLKMLCWHIVKCKSNSSVIYFCSDSRLYPIFG